MKKHLLFLAAFLLAACSGTPAQANVPPATETSVIQDAPTRQEITPTASQQPSETAIPATPTQDLLAMPTRTAQPAAACPAIDAKKRIQLGAVFKDKKAAWHDVRPTVLEFLNEGGDPTLAQTKLAENNVQLTLRDITHDGVQELILPNNYLTVWGCDQGKFKTLLEIAPDTGARGDMPAVPLVIQDLNQNGVPELFIGQASYLRNFNFTEWGFVDVTEKVGAVYWLLEWDGAAFTHVLSQTSEKNMSGVFIEKGQIITVGTSNAQKGALNGNWEVADKDGNGLKDVVIRGGVTNETKQEQGMILQWNGRNYTVAKTLKGEPPTARPNSTPLPTSTPRATSTPLPFSATCANIDPARKYLAGNDGTGVNNLLAFLNQNGDPQEFKSHFSVTVEDLNADSAPEVLLLEPSSLGGATYLFSCVQGQYVFIQGAQHPKMLGNAQLMKIEDNNKNGYPEVFLKETGCAENSCGAFYVLEWEGKRFVHEIIDGTKNYVEISFPSDSYLKDIDGDGIKELVVIGENVNTSTQKPGTESENNTGLSASVWNNYPERLATHTYKWDGQHYAAQVVEYAPPKYQFQAIQDGDRYANAGLYEKALPFYKLAIRGADLDWWSQERKDFIIGSYGVGPCANKVCQSPTEDPNERPTLSAYASFRTIVTQLLMGKPEAAQAEYQALLTAHPESTPGFVVTQMATTFWEEYQSAQNMGNACAKALDYASTQPSLFKYLSGGKNAQNIDYERAPATICPFK